MQCWAVSTHCAETAVPVHSATPPSVSMCTRTTAPRSLSGPSFVPKMRALAGAAATPMRAAAAMTDVVTRRSMRDSFTWLFIVSARPEGTDRSHATHGATCGDFTERSPASWRRCADNLPTSVADPSKLYRAYGPAPESERGERHSPGNLPGGDAHREWGVHLP
ncbi:hypothetical protein WU86_09695 [Corynebacterium xerosis]|nr:hypothetical protein WU86_09695 [Corynebacterium xerosis]